VTDLRRHSPALDATVHIDRDLQVVRIPPAAVLAAESGLSIERATIALSAAHTSPRAAGKVFRLAKPRTAGLGHTLLSPKVIPLVFSEIEAVYDGPVVQTQDFTVFNVSREAVVARQAAVQDHPPRPRHAECRLQADRAAPPRAWWADALLPPD
jgi:ribonuclease Z